MNMKTRHSPLLKWTIALALSLSALACSKNDNAPSGASTAGVAKTGITASSLDTVASQAKGFSVGAVMSAQTTYVLFDPQCPHCGRLWEASLPLHNTMKFVWVPISFGSPKSMPQGAALLSAANPLEAMNAHEKSLLGGSGGMAASSDVPKEMREAIEANTKLLTSLGVDSVPFLIGKNRQTGSLITHTGAMDTAALAQLLGLN